LLRAGDIETQNQSCTLTIFKKIRSVAETAQVPIANVDGGGWRAAGYRRRSASGAIATSRRATRVN
jgi:hypothetical protein